MGTIVSQVIDQLKNAGIRADEAYPGSRIPALKSPVAAVRLGKVDRSKRVTAVQVVIMSPSSGGGSQCERVSLETVDVLENMGGSCGKEICKFDEMADVFYIDITAEFFGSAQAEDWSAGPGYAVAIGEQPLPHVTRFSAERKIGGDVAAIGAAKWQFTVEELLPPGYSEPSDPQEPFALTVSRSNIDELFRNCTLTSVKRENTIRGVSQVRTGIAESRSVMGIL